MLGKLPVPRRPTNLDYSRARAYCACSRCGWRLFRHFSLVYHFSFLPPSLWETARYRLKYCLKGPLSLKTTNQENHYHDYVLENNQGKKPITSINMNGYSFRELFHFHFASLFKRDQLLKERICSPCEQILSLNS